MEQQERGAKAGAVGDPVQAQRQMPLRLAKALIARIEEEASLRGVNAVIAVSDAAGHPVAVHCMDGAYIGSYDVALNKAFTAAAFQRSTKELGEQAQPGAPLYGIQFTNGGRIVVFGGGEPLTQDGGVIGALGVSGGTAEQDTALAEYGKTILKEVISCL
ncbi:MAG: heme-binding protein [Eubacteriales bacterium]|nr:heme-binding protein [Eubacteriales bacterium]